MSYQQPPAEPPVGMSNKQFALYCAALSLSGRDNIPVSSLHIYILDDAKAYERFLNG